LTDYQTGVALRELYSHAGLFVLPSALEGHPIALLEALSYGLPVFASANDANLAVPLPRDRFFPVGDTDALARMLAGVSSSFEYSEARWQSLTKTIRELYSWRHIASLTRTVYEDVIREHAAVPIGRAHG
jgi:glycosyltransferase involved in cell wall biosynthesis